MDCQYFIFISPFIMAVSLQHDNADQRAEYEAPPLEFSQSKRHLVGIKMLDVMAEEYGIDRRIRHSRHIQHRAHDVRVDVFVDVQA